MINVPSSKKSEKEKKPSCFVIMPIADQKGYDANHFTYVYEDIIKPAIIEAGMEVDQARADEVKNSNLIHLDILRKVIESDIAICDMSSRNPNVFYELGMRQAFDKPTVLIRDEETAVPFDINGLRYVEYKKGMRHRDVLKAVDDLAEMLKATYDKKDDKNEVNSLIRLMDLTAAKVQHVELSDEEKSNRILDIKIDTIQQTLQDLVKFSSPTPSISLTKKKAENTSLITSKVSVKISSYLGRNINIVDVENSLKELPISIGAKVIKARVLPELSDGNKELVELLIEVTANEDPAFILKSIYTVVSVLEGDDFKLESVAFR